MSALFYSAILFPCTYLAFGLYRVDGYHYLAFFPGL